MKKQLIYQNKKITYQVFGNGKPVMLMHGFGEEANIWDALVEFLQGKFQRLIRQQRRNKYKRKLPLKH